MKSGVVVPTHCYKIIVDEFDGRIRVLAFLFPQQIADDGVFRDYLVSVDELETFTGLDFLSLLPDEAEEMLEANPAKWV